MGIKKVQPEEIKKKIAELLVENLGVDKEEVTDNTDIVEDLGADSLDLVELVMAFEEAFGIEIPDEEAAKLTTVKAVQEYLEKRLK